MCAFYVLLLRRNQSKNKIEKYSANRVVYQLSMVARPHQLLQLHLCLNVPPLTKHVLINRPTSRMTVSIIGHVVELDGVGLLFVDRIDKSDIRLLQLLLLMRPRRVILSLQ